MAEASLSQDPYEGQVIAGRYHVGRRIGAGGTAHVYSAVQEPMGREVAIKILRADLEGPEAAQIGERLLREAQLIARLSHPGIVTVHDCGILPGGAVYLVMERVRGVPLATLLVGPMEAQRVVRLASGVARALRHAHVNGVIHRDVKPSNILICVGEDGQEVPKLLDFGIGKGGEQESQTTVVGRFVGTPQYASPEQAEGRPDVDGRADIYSLGCMMYRMLTGVLPFEADTALGVAYKQVHAPWPPMSSRSATPVDPRLEGVVKRAMEKRPEDRYADADSLLQALEAWSSGGLFEEEFSGAMTLVGAPPPVGAPARPSPLPVRAESPKVEAPPVESPKTEQRSWAWIPVLMLGFFFLLATAGGLGGWWWLHRSAPSTNQTAASAISEPNPNPAEATIPATAPPSDATNSTAPPPVATNSAAPPSEAGPSTPSQSAASNAPSTPSEATTTPPKTGHTPSAPSNTSSNHTPKTPKSPTTSSSSKTYATPIYIDDLLVQPEDATRTLRWLNTADEATLRASGMYARGVNIILQNRPFASLEAFAATPQIGTKTVQSAISASK